MRSFLLVALLVAVGCKKKEEGGGWVPSEVKEKASAKGIPEDWTHGDLKEHFAKTKSKLRIVPGGSSLNGSVVYIVDQDSPIKEEKETDDANFKRKPEVVLCKLLKTTREAKEEADARGAKAFSSGRFLFDGEPDMLKRVRESLP